LSLLRRRLVAGGVLAVWSAMAAPAFEAALRKLFVSVQVHLVEVPRGDPDHVYVASVPSGYGGRRPGRRWEEHAIVHQEPDV
jgi:hypothetical protein